MKVKKHYILTVISLAAIVGPALQSGGAEKPLPDKVTQRWMFLQGMFFSLQTQMVMVDNLFTNPKKELEGIREVMVLVEEVPQETERYGLTRQVLQTDTELRLRQHEIKVVTFEEEKKRMVERWKQQIEHLKHMQDLIQAKDYEKALIEIEEPYKSLLRFFIGEESDQRFLEAVAEYVKHSYPTEDATQPSLYINVLPAILRQGDAAVGAAISINIEFQTTTILTRGSSSVFAKAVLWDRGCLISRGLDNLSSEVRHKVRDLVDEFINDYLAANASTEKPTPTVTRGLISAISYGDSPSVLIDGQIKRIGDTIHGVKIVKIQKDKVEFEKNGNTWVQRNRRGAKTILGIN
jgi:hypothetical protein